MLREPGAFAPGSFGFWKTHRVGAAICRQPFMCCVADVVTVLLIATLLGYLSIFFASAQRK